MSHVYVLKDYRSGKVFNIDFENSDGEIKRKYTSLLKYKALPQLMMDYPEDFEITRIAELDEGTLQINEVPHFMVFRLSELVTKEIKTDGQEDN